VPELPEVENVALALRDCLTGRRLTGMTVLFGGILEPSPRAVKRAILGKTLVAVRRQGKYLLLTFAEGPDRESGGRDGFARDAGPGTAHLMIHLRMTGQLYLDPDRAPDKHTHLVLDFAGRRVCYRDIRKFGRFTLLDSPNAPVHVGPDMLEIGFADWRDRAARRRAPIKAVLLDQGVASGVGNIYADEALFRAGVHPLAQANSLDDAALRRVFREARAVMRLAIRHGGTTYMNFVDFNGQPGNFRRKLRVYQRDGEPCSRCGTSIERVKVAGRSSHFCPACQPMTRSPRARGRIR
jgi:formamidopyrimidine-DNA glycosylase